MEINMKLWEEKSFSDCYRQRNYSKLSSYKLIKDLKFNSILDVGCARGGLSKLLMNKKYTGIDVSRNMISENEREMKNNIWCVGSILDLPFDDNSFDVVVCNDVLIHLNGQDWIRGIDECFRVANSHVVLGYRQKIGETVYSTQSINGFTVPYIIFGKEFLRLVSKYGNLVNYYSFIMIGKSWTYGFPVFGKTVLIKKELIG